MKNAQPVRHCWILSFFAFFGCHWTSTCAKCVRGTGRPVLFVLASKIGSDVLGFSSLSKARLKSSLGSEEKSVDWRSRAWKLGIGCSLVFNDIWEDSGTLDSWFALSPRSDRSKDFDFINGRVSSSLSSMALNPLPSEDDSAKASGGGSGIGPRPSSWKSTLCIPTSCKSGCNKDSSYRCWTVAIDSGVHSSITIVLGSLISYLSGRFMRLESAWKSATS